jgi:alpha-L-fucosidase 2
MGISMKYRVNIGSCLIFAAVISIAGCSVESENDRLLACSERNSNLRLWYDSPADVWDEALPVGNGRLGAMVFGTVDRERIQLNEESLWAGTRINNNNPLALRYLDEIRELLLTGRNDEALALAERYLVGTPPDIRSYQTLGDLFLEFDYGAAGGDALAVEHYIRDLDLQTGIASVEYGIGERSYRREVFASAPDNIIVINISGDDGAVFGVTVKLDRERDAVPSKASRIPCW